MSDPDEPADTPSPGDDAAPKGEASPSGSTAPAEAEARTGRWILILLAAIFVVAGLIVWLELRGPAGSASGEGGELDANGQPREPVVVQRPPLELSGRVGLEVKDAGSPTPRVVPPRELEKGCKVVAWQAGRKLGETDDCDDHGGWTLTIDDEVNGQVAVEVLVPGRLRGVVAIEVEGRGKFELPELALGIGYTLRGQVLDSQRQPLAGATVHGMPEPNLDEPEPWRATTDAEGYFEFDTFPAGPINLSGYKPGFASSVVDAIAPGDEVTLILDDLVALEGEVIADASMLARARVRLEGSAVWPPIDKALGEGVTPAALAAQPGAFIFPELVDGIYGVEVYVPAPEGAVAGTAEAKEYASIPLENVAPSMHVSLALVPAYRVPVQVVDPDQKPVPNAKVSLSYGTVAMLQKHALADLEGKAAVGPVVPGPYWVRAEADGYLPAAPQAIDVGPDAKPPEPLVLARPATVRGVVQDERGNPVADAEVWLDAEIAFASGEAEARAGLLDAALGLRPGFKAVGTLGVTTGPVPPIPSEHEADLPGGLGAGPGGELGLAVRTEEDGSFELTMLPPGEFELRARHGGHAESRTQKVQLSSGQVVEGVTLVLREGQPLSGRVLDGNGNPLTDALVQVGDELLGVDEAGVFEAGLWRGKTEVIVRAPGMVPVKKKVRVGTRAVELEFELEAADGVLDLRVVDANGRPVQGAEFMVQSADGLSPTAIDWSDDAGVLAFSGLTKGEVTLRIEHPNYVPIEKTFDVGDRASRREFVLDEGWVLEVLVRAAGSGARLPDAQVDVDGQVVSTGEDGLAAVPRLSTRRAEVEVSKTGWGKAKASAKRPEGNARGELTVELEETGSIRGELTDDIGDPVAGATVRAYDDGGDLIASTKTDATGQFELLELPEGEVELRVRAPAAAAQGESDPEAPQLQSIRERSDVRRGQVTRDVQLRFERG